MEAPRKKAAAFPVVNHEELLGKVMHLMAVLQGMNFEFKADWVSGLVDMAKQKKLEFDRQAAEDAERQGDEFNPSEWQFDVKEVYAEIAEPFYRKASHAFNFLADAQVAERVYQDQMVRDPDNLSDMVEDSDYLRCIRAQRNLGQAIESINPSRVSTFTNVIHGIEGVIETFRNAMGGGDQRVPPEWLDSVEKELCHLLPLMRFTLRNAMPKPVTAPSGSMNSQIPPSPSR
jgi:hypothetical protein